MPLLCAFAADEQQRIALGAYPDLSLKQAREQRDDLRAQIAQGIDPRIHRLQTMREQQSPDPMPASMPLSLHSAKAKCTI